MIADLALAAHLRSLEEHLLDPAVRADRAALEAVLTPDFCEFGSSGGVFDRPAIFALLATEQPQPMPMVQDVTCALLAPAVALVTYRIERPGSPSSLRSSVWIKT